MSDEGKKRGEEPGTVLTPGGRRAPELVHAVRSDETVQFDASGKAAKRTLDPRRAEDAQQLVARGLVLTPGGFRHPSLVHQVSPREVIRAPDDRVAIHDLETNALLREIAPPLAEAGVVPALGSGWIVNSGWTNNTGNPISTFRTTWHVPPEPRTKGSQTIFLFNGIDPSNHSDAILQPVLQWGSSAAGGGQYWSVASWYVLGNGNAFHTTPVRVNPGDELVGVMTMTRQAMGKFDYAASFDGIANTTLTIQNVAELVWCNETLEAYSLNQASDYPDTDRTVFSSISITTTRGFATPAWTLTNTVTDVGQHAELRGADVLLYYRNGYAKDILPETAIGGPALININDTVMAVAWTGTDSQHHLNVANSRDEGATFRGKVILRETSFDGPGFAYGNGRAFLAWTGTDSAHHLNVVSSVDCVVFTNKVTLGDTSRFGPALAFGNGRLYIAWVGTDSAWRLNVMSSTDGINWGNKVTLNESSDSAPGLCFANGKLYLLWQGTDRNSSLNVLESTDGVHFTNKVILRDSSAVHPVMASFREQLVLGWTGTDSAHHLNTLASSSGTHGFGGKQILGDTSAAGPSLVTFKGRLYYGWTGTDSSHHVNVMAISG